MRSILAGKLHGFDYSPTGEPHRRRRREILAKHPEIAELHGYDVSTTWTTVAVVLTQLGIAAALAWGHGLAKPWAAWWVVVLVAYFAGSILAHWAGQSIHETTHNLAWKGALANRCIGMFANLPLVMPAAMSFRRYHLDHHRYLGVVGEDTDLPLGFERSLIGNVTARKTVWLLLYFFFYNARSFTFMKRPDRFEVVNFVAQMAFNAVFFWCFGWTALVYLALSGVFGHSLHPVAAHFIHEHYVFRPGQETYSYYGPLNKVTFNVGYHVEHHDFMSVPGSRLPRLHAMAREYYAGLESHTSWTWVLWHFATAKTMSVASRIVRTPADYARARQSSE